MPISCASHSANPASSRRRSREMAASLLKVSACVMIIFIIISSPLADSAIMCSDANRDCTADPVCREKRTIFAKVCHILDFPRPTVCFEGCLTAYRTLINNSRVGLDCVCSQRQFCLITDVNYVRSVCDPATSTSSPASREKPNCTSGAATVTSVCPDSVGLVLVFAALMKLLPSAL